jgi:hypothetical protein
VTWEIDYDPATWLEVPDLADDEVEQWVERAATAVVDDFANEGTLDASYGAVLRHQLAILAGLAHRKAAHGWLTLAHLPGPDWYPFGVHVAFLEPRAESPDYLLELAGARGLPAVQPPSVEHIVVDDLGEGIRVVRYEDDAELGLIANLCYAWRAHDTDVVLFAQTDDLSRLEEIGPDLVALVSAIRPARAAQARDGG